MSSAATWAVCSPARRIVVVARDRQPTEPDRVAQIARHRERRIHELDARDGCGVERRGLQCSRGRGEQKQQQAVGQGAHGEPPVGGAAGHPNIRAALDA
jgi:hypothetical protein